MANDNDFKSDYDDVHSICKQGWDGFLIQAGTDLDFYHKAQHTNKEAEAAEIQGRTLYTIDKLGRQVNLIHGYEVRNRHILKIGPQGMPDEQEDEACRQHTGVTMSLMARRGGYNMLSNGFKWGPLVQGSNLIEIWRDRNGDLQFSRIGWNGFLLDPSLTKTDLSDCDNILTGRWISEDKAKFLIPTAGEKIDKINPLSHSLRWDYLGAPPLNNKGKRRLYEEWWHRKTEYEETVISRVSGQEISLKDFAAKFFNGDMRYSKRQIQEKTLPNGAPALSRYSKPRDVIYLTIFVDDKFVWNGPNPLKMDDYNFVWLHGDWCPEQSRDELKLQSFVRGLRDPQRARNRRVNQCMDIVETQIQSLRVVRDKYIRNVEDVYRSGQGVVIHTTNKTPDGLSLDNILYQGTGAPLDPGLLALLEVLEKDGIDAGGLNQEILGADDKDIPGILHKYRTGAALTGQQGIFEGYRESKRQLGIKLVKLVQLNYPPDKIRQILNEEPVPGFYTPDLMKYDCTPTEGLLTDNQQNLFYLELKGLRQVFPDFQQVITPSMLVQASPIQFKKQLLDAIKQAEQQQSQVMQEQMQDKKRMDKLMEAQAEEDIAQAEESRTGAALDRASTAAKIQETEAKSQELGIKPYMESIKMALELEKIKQMQRVKK